MIGSGRFLASLALVVGIAGNALPALAQDAQATTTAPAAPAAAPEIAPPADPAPIDYAYLAITTSAGTITLALDRTHAPITSANFLRYVDTRRLDGATFYRAMHLPYSEAPEGLLQGGVRDVAKLFPPIAHEPTNRTGLLHKAGTISMARFGRGSARADFMILVSDMPALDADKDPAKADTDEGAGFAAFGHVVSGMDVALRLWNQPRSASKGEGVMKGDMLENEVSILSARRLVNPPAN